MIDPRGLNVQQWCDLCTQTLSTYGNIPTLMSDKDWPLWAAIIITIPIIAQYAPPDPRYFDDWRTWAERFIELIPL